MIRPFRHASVPLTGLTMAVLLVGCGKRTIAPAASSGSSGPSVGAEQPGNLDWSGLSLTLNRITVGDSIDCQQLLEHRDALDRFLSGVAGVGPNSTPQLFPDRRHRLAYTINCHNAAILRSVLQLLDDRGPQRRVPRDIDRRYRFRIDGRLQSPEDLRRSAKAQSEGDWRVDLAMCDVTRTGPPLPRRVFLGDVFDAQLNQVTRAAIASPRVVRIDHGEQKRLLVWRGLYDIKDRLIHEHEVRYDTSNACLLNVLLAWSDRRHREFLNSALGYDVALMPSDDELNALEPSDEEDGGIFSAL